MPHPSLTQQQALAIIPHITGWLSFLGSCSILYDIWCNRKRKLQRPYYRILLGISIYDAVSSFSLGLSTWPIPRGAENIYGAVGNTQTCTAQGFFNQLSLGGPMYNLMLAIYYLLLGRYRLTEEEIAKRYELYMHLTAVLSTVGVAIAGLPLTLYNNANLWCWIAAWPPGSEGFDGHEHEDNECLRGHGSWLYRWVFFYGPLWFIIAAITVIMIMLTVSIRSEERSSIQMMQKNARPQEECSDMPTGHYASPEPRLEVVNLERSRKMFHQAAFYLFAFYLTWWAPTINRMVQMTNGESYYFFMVMTAFFAPLQGFLNFIVYRHGPCVA
ncbi:hypothetical protein ACHAXR_001682 [Thalassiosira sp. AJA248-18]